jgi:hypothetical protein
LSSQQNNIQHMFGDLERQQSAIEVIPEIKKRVCVSDVNMYDVDMYILSPGSRLVGLSKKP